ncbi:MAG: hypothetical protein J2P27_18365 [Actinobacteria bacterium]|nr:hypothetical protein [Actinomycetota bacterium]
MPSQDQDHSPEPSRRSLLRRGAVVGAAGLAVAAGGGGALAAVMSSHSNGNAQLAGGRGSGPIVIYLADPASGEMEIFAGTGRTRHTNRAMASMVASMAPTK